MIIIKSVNRLKKEVNFKAKIGFVPTMGSLHKGHLSLIESSKKKSEKTLVSIFVNPSQFNSNIDYKKYPRNITKDINLLNKLKVDYVFIPNVNDIYKKEKDAKIRLFKKEKILCAKFRKGHFEGVLGVVNQFLKIIKATYMFLGEKDFQQIYLIKKFIKKKYKVKIISCPTIRNSNFFAYSSRNSLLKKNEINNATKIIKKVKKLHNEIKKNFVNSSKIRSLRIDILKLCRKIDYLEIRNKNNLSIKFNKQNFKIFIAFYINKVRLIDNF